MSIMWDQLRLVGSLHILTTPSIDKTYYVFLFILLVNEQCGVNKFSPNPHIEIDDACYVLKAKQAHDRFDGRCVEFNEVCGCETGNSGSKSTAPSRIVS